MTKYSKLNRFFTVLIAGIIFSATTSCEKDTGDLGLNALPPTDGLTVRYDSINISGYTYVPDPVFRTELEGAICIGSYQESLPNGETDNIILTTDLPMYLNDTRLWDNENIETIYEARFTFKDFDSIDSLYYVYGDSSLTQYFVLYERVFLADSTIDRIPIDTLEYTFGNNNFITEDSANVYSHLLDSAYTQKLADIIQGIRKEFPLVDTAYYWKDGLSEEVWNYQLSEYQFAGFALTPLSEEGSITRIVNPSIHIKFHNDNREIEETDNLFRSFSTGEETYGFEQKSYTAYHSNWVTTEGAFIQGMMSHKTVLDFSFADKWFTADSSMSVDRARVKFKAKENIDGLPRLEQINFQMIDTVADSVLYNIPAYLNDEDIFTFDIATPLNTFIIEGRPSTDYSFELVCPNNNLTANKVELEYENGNYLQLTYTKY